jgi:hypothetical protein
MNSERQTLILIEENLMGKESHFEDRKSFYVQQLVFKAKGSGRGTFNPQLTRELGDKLGLFVYQFSRVEAALDAYQDALVRDMPTPCSRGCILATTTVRATNPAGLILALAGAALATSSTSSESPKPATVEYFEAALDAELETLRNIMTASMAIDWTPAGTWDQRVEMEKVKVAVEKEVAKARAAAAAQALTAFRLRIRPQIVAMATLDGDALADQLVSTTATLEELIRGLPPGVCQAAIDE